MPSLTTSTADVLTRMLRRLPPSLWDTDPQAETLQRDLYRAFAEQMAVWLENREIARTMTLLLEAQGVDLDVLLEDYGLKRYLQRPDPYARQVGMHILWHPQGTLDCIRILADLLFDVAHVTMRTGRSEQHIFVADTHPITTPYNYWGLVSDEGLWYAVTVDGEVPTISQAPPPGLDVSPGPHTLRWFTVPDLVSGIWYVTIRADTLFVSGTSPAGYGTTDLFEVQDGAGTRWHLFYDSQAECLITSFVSTGLPPLTLLTPNHIFQAVLLHDGVGSPWWLSLDGATFQITTTLPTGASDVTPPGGPYRWLRVYDLGGTYWYLYPHTEGGGTTLVTDTVSPGGLGTVQPQSLGDTQGSQWHYGIDPSGVLASSDAPHVDYGGMASSICLNDAHGNRWFWRVRNGTLDWSPQLWPDTCDQSPWGELSWLQAQSQTGTPLYIYPSTTGVPLVGAGPPTTSYWGWQDPVFFVDTDGQRWQLTVALLAGVGYWRMRNAAGTVYGLSMDAEVPTIVTPPPAGGVDQTPGGVTLDWLTVPDEGGVNWYATLEADNLTVAQTVPAGLGTGTAWPVQMVDSAGQGWSVQTRSTTEALISLPTPAPYVARVVQAEGSDIPPLAGALSLRDVVDACGHIQAAGSLVSVVIS
jgi:hypothetical protein